jgi:GTP pyrophosphokinase
VQLGKISKGSIETVAGDYGYGKIEDLHAALGYGKYSPRQVLQKLAPDQVPAEAPVEQSESATEVYSGGEGKGADKDLVLKVRGADDLLVYRAKCCNPIRGEAIVGYVTRGKGVAVHSNTCSNVQNLMYEVERKIDVEWARAVTETFPVRVVVHTDDRPGMLNQLTSALFAEQSNIRSLEASSDDKRGDGAIIDMTLEIRDKKQLERVAAAIRRISGVRDVERTQ